MYNVFMPQWILGSLSLTVGIFIAITAQATTEDTLAELRSQCYDVYKAQYDDALTYLPSVASQDIDVTQLDLPEALEQNFGVSEADLTGLADLTDALQQANEFMAPYAQEAYLELAQINIDLADCYLEQGADAQPLRDQAQANYDAIADYNFLDAFSSQPTGTPVITVTANTTQTIRLRAYCLDSGGDIPDTGEEYYLAGTLDQLQGDSLCTAIQSAKTFDEISAAQGEIWTTNTALLPSSELDDVIPGTDEPTTTTTAIETTIQNNISNPVATGVAIGGGVLALVSMLALVLHWGPKPLAISGIILGAGLATTGIVLAKEIATPSLYQAAQQGQVIVTATSPGSFTALDVTIQNLTDQDLTLSTTCLRFIPKTSTHDPDLAVSYDNYDITVEDINAGEVDWDDIEESYDDAEYDEGHNAQRLGTGDVIDDDPPPLPPPPPEPEDTLDIEELKRRIKDQMDAAEKKFKEDPTEDNLRDLIEETQKCQALGCSEHDPMDDVGDTWQKNVDKALEQYKNDPSDLNRQALERATEIGQAFGSNTDAAVDALLNQ